MSLEIEGGSSRLPPHLVHHTATLHNCTHINTIYSYNLMQFRINSDTILHLGTIFKIINECHTHLDTISSPCEKEITTHHINLPKWYRIVFCLCVHTHTQWLSQAIPPKSLTAYAFLHSKSKRTHFPIIFYYEQHELLIHIQFIQSITSTISRNFPLLHPDT